MEEEIEILEPVNTDRYLYSKLVNFKVATKEVATVVVNGEVQQTQEVSYVVLTCPNCDRVLYKMPQGLSIVDVNKMFLSESKKLEGNMMHYCPDCGQKLTFTRELVSDNK